MTLFRQRQPSQYQAFVPVRNVFGSSMQVCEGTDAVAPNARSHSALLSGVFIGDATSLVRLKFGIETSTREVALHVTVRSDTLEVSELVHQIIQDA